MARFFAMVSLLALTLAAPASALMERRGRQQLQADPANPVMRVVGLLQDLAKKLEAEMKAEDKACAKFECWKTSTKAALEAEKGSADAVINANAQMQNDIDSGKHTFTTEKVDLTKEVADLTSQRDTMVANRAQENKDFLAGEAEMIQAKTALDSAIDTIQKGTGLELISKSSHLVTFQHRRAMRQAMQLGRGLLSESDRKFMMEIVDRQPEDKDWEKLNKKADFKDEYKASSGKILQLLKKLLHTFTKNLEDAQNTEKEAAANHLKLLEAKEAQLKQSQDALDLLAEENGAQGKKKAELQAEIDELEALNEKRKTANQNIDAAFAIKDKDCKDRKVLRQEELTEIQKAIAVLYSDEARDQMKKTFASQGYLLLQEASVRVAASKVANSALDALRATGKTSTDPRLALVAAKLASVSPASQHESIQKVVDMVDALVADLQTQADKELATKEACEQNRMDQTRDAKEQSNKVDDYTDSINRFSDEIDAHKSKILAQGQVVTDTNKMKVDLKTQCDADAARYVQEGIEDEKGIALLVEAMGIIRAMREKTFGSALATVKRRVQKKAEPDTTEALKKAAEAPTDGPVGEYKGAAGEVQGIEALLNVIHEDMVKDRDDTITAMNDAAGACQKQQGDFDQIILDAEAVQKSEGDMMVAKEGHRDQADTDRKEENARLSQTMILLAGEEPECNFYLVNYDVRVKSRQLEIAGLNKAKAILMGAKFG